MALFQEREEERFVDRTTAYFRVKFADAIAHLDEVTLRRMVQAGIARARRHGLTWESSLVRFLLLMFQVAPNFDQHPAFARALSDVALPEAARMAEIFERVTPEEWREAQLAYDDRAWDEGTVTPC